MKRIYFIAMLIAVSMTAWAQLCTNPTDTVYGLNSITGSGSGQIIAVNVNNAGATPIGSAASGSENANGLGFSQVTGKYYFFNKCGNGTATATEFVSYLPLSGTKQVLSKPPFFPNNQKMRSGTVNKAGSAYYCIFPGATAGAGSYPVTGPAFYYYNIGTDTWTLITQVFKDKNGNIVTNVASLNSGDMAFDGNDNLWMLCSSQTAYALYKIKAPLPTTATAFITVDTIIAQTPTPSQAAGASPVVGFTGIAFNSAGKMYISSGSASGTVNAFHNKLYMLATPSSPLAIVGTFAVNGYGDDLTSCTYPVGVLPVTWVDFNASMQNNSIRLGWKINEETNITGYDVQFSTDATHWQNIAHVNKDNTPAGLKQYSYTHSGYSHGNNYYRIVETDASGKQDISVIRVVSDISERKVYLAPNPTRDILFFYHKDNSSKMMAQVFDKSGLLVYSTVVGQSQQSISVAHLPKGVYILKLLSAESNRNDEGYQFVKM